MRIRLAALAVLLLALGACGGDDESTADPEAEPSQTSAPATPVPTPTPTDAPVSTPAETPEEPDEEALDVEIAGDEVSPNAAAVDLDTGEPLVLRITADRAGELHVHSRPEQYVEFAAGTSEHELVVDTPGSVEVEEHESGAVVAVLRVGG
jgi:hypothetical protein